MKSLTLLLIPLLFFMTSCSIDWNDEKNKKIAELEKEIQSIHHTYSLYKRNSIFEDKPSFALEDTKIIENLTGQTISEEKDFFTYDDCSVYYKKIKISTLCEVGPKPTKDEFETYIQDNLPQKWSIQNLTFNAPKSSFIIYKTGFNSLGGFAEYMGIIGNKSLYNSYMQKVDSNSYPNAWSGSLGKYELDIQKIYGSDVLFIKNDEVNFTGLKRIGDESLYEDFMTTSEYNGFIWAGDGYIIALVEPPWIGSILESLKK